MENKYLTVSAVNRYLAYKFENDPALRDILIKGELSNFRASGGHLYFSLKDEESEIRAIMFAGAARRLLFMPRDGMTVIIRAQVSVYQKGGTYNLNVQTMEEAGLGDIYLNFLRLKEKLSKEGLFDEDKKLKLPAFPKKIGVITSPTADAFQDIISTFNKRFPYINIYLYSALVQGAEAPASVMSALNRANRDKIVDVIIIARGGGSFEDLSCFNNEMLARAIFASAIPTVTGIGHETDYTIADYVSSRRAPTPTGAAVLVTKDQNEIARNVNEKMNLIVHYYKRILEKKYYDYQNIITRHHFKNFIQSLEYKEKELERLTYNLKVHSPLALVENNLNRVRDFQNRLIAYNMIGMLNDKEHKTDSMIERFTNSYRRELKLLEQKVNNNLQKLNILNPVHLMEKGYTLTYQNGKLLTRQKDIDLGKAVTVRFYDGKLITKPIEKTNEE